jgi:hypothetical protein
MGYIVSPPAPGNLTFIVHDADCQFTAAVPLALSTVAQPPRPISGLAGSDRIVANRSFDGTDMERSHFDGLTVFGSVKASDHDIGSIRLTLHHGDFLYYRTGMNARRQTVMVPGMFPSIPMGVASEWERVWFGDPRLPDTFDVEFKDDGDGPGEWSAIAVGAASPAQ